MVTIVAFIILALVVVALVLLGLMYLKVSRNSPAALESRLELFEKAQERTERVVKEEIALNRGELGKAAGDQRQELSSAFKTFGDSVGQRINDVASLQKAQLESFSGELSKFTAESGASSFGTFVAGTFTRISSAPSSVSMKRETRTRARPLSSVLRALTNKPSIGVSSASRLQSLSNACGTIATPILSVLPRHNSLPLQSEMRTSASATGFALSSVVTQTAPFSRPNLTCTDKLVTSALVRTNIGAGLPSNDAPSFCDSSSTT